MKEIVRKEVERRRRGGRRRYGLKRTKKASPGVLSEDRLPGIPSPLAVEIRTASILNSLNAKNRFYMRDLISEEGKAKVARTHPHL